jgi:hypothetical protein
VNVTADRDAFSIEPNAFVSGTLADRVGVLHVPDPSLLPADAGVRITDAARRQGLQLVTFSSERPMTLSGFADLGRLDEYAGPASDLRTRLRVSGHFPIVPLTPERWPLVETLLDYAAPTRFSRDPRLTSAIVRRHKLMLLRHHYLRSPEYSLLALSVEHGPLGLQASYVRDASFVLYELMTRTGLVAAELLAANLDLLQRRRPEITDVRTHIYSDNPASIAFFTRLGLRPTGQRTHHYHLWP